MEHSKTKTQEHSNHSHHNHEHKHSHGHDHDHDHNHSHGGKLAVTLYMIGLIVFFIALYFELNGQEGLANILFKVQCNEKNN